MSSESAKRKQKKQILQLCILAAVLIILVIVFFVARYLNNQAELAEEEAASVTYEVEYLEDATTVVITNSEETQTYVYDADDETWYWSEDEEFPLNSNYITGMLNTWSALESSSQLEITDDLSAYGLDPAECSAEITTDDGETLTLLMGIESGDYYYCMIEGDEYIYLVSSTIVNYLNYTLYDLASLETFPSTSSTTLETITVSGTVETEFYQETVETETTDDDGETTTTTESYWYTVDGEDVTEADYLSEMTSEVIGLGFDSMVNFYTTDDDLAEAGLDAPQCIVTVTYTETDDDGNESTESFTLEVGSLTEDEGYYYTTINGGTTIYLMDVDEIATIMSVAEGGADVLYAEEEE